VTPTLTIAQQSASYPVWIERGVLDRTGSLVACDGRVFVVTSARLRAVGDRVARSFDPPAAVIEIEEGEEQKTLATANAIVTAMLERGARRDSLVVAVGGGMIGDTAGFAASIFMRGVGIVQVPTTLLAQVDSSIGGKVGVNHAKGKNLLGSFHPPRGVLIDPTVLDSLGERDFRSGLFEAVKGGVIADPALFALFESQLPGILERTPGVLDEVIRRKVQVKATIVSADERESGIRRLLNYGHTIGHGIEAALQYRDVTHGEAVGLGMLAANAIAVQRRLLLQKDAARIDAVIRALAPVTPAAARLDDVLEAVGHDKKNTAARRVMVLPVAIGDCRVFDDVSASEIEQGARAVLG
jgi:3-dehydroquinate synthase